MASVNAAHCKINDSFWYLHTVNQWHHEKNTFVNLTKDIKMVLMIFQKKSRGIKCKVKKTSSLIL